MCGLTILEESTKNDILKTQLECMKVQMAGGRVIAESRRVKMHSSYTEMETEPKNIMETHQLIVLYLQ